jgi:hypothetical protein
MVSAVVLGGAEGVWSELEAARHLFTPDIVIATNHAGIDYDGHVDHWVSFHAELLPMWIDKRAAAGRAPAGRYWTVERRMAPATPLELSRVPNWGGSSGLVAVTVALHLQCSHIVCCGVPLDLNVAHYDDPKPWREAGNYRRAWMTYRSQMTAVRSMSGWTRQILGAPTGEWFDEGQEQGRRSARGAG